MSAPITGASIVELGVWPAYVGISEDPAHRGQITWRHDGGQIVGAARIHAPAGTYTKLYYFHTPDGPPTGGIVEVLPITLDEDGVIDIDPITM